MSPILPNKVFSPYLGIIIRPNFLAAVCRLDEVLSDSSPLSHLFCEFLVHQTRCKHLEGSPFVLDMNINRHETGPNITCLPDVATSHPAWKQLYQLVCGSNVRRTLFYLRAMSYGSEPEAGRGHCMNRPTCPPAPRARMTSSLTSSIENSSLFAWSDSSVNGRTLPFQ